MFEILTIWFHLLAAMFWIGGTLFFAFVVIPSLKEVVTKEQRLELISRIGRRFKTFGWISLSILLFTGTLRLYQNGISLSSYGRTLWIKLSLVVVVLLLALIHDFILGPKSIALSRQISTSQPLQKQVRWIARMNLLIGLLVVLSAVFLSRGF